MFTCPREYDPPSLSWGRKRSWMLKRSPMMGHYVWQMMILSHQETTETVPQRPPSDKRWQSGSFWPSSLGASPPMIHHLLVHVRFQKSQTDPLLNDTHTVNQTGNRQEFSQKSIFEFHRAIKFTNLICLKQSRTSLKMGAIVLKQGPSKGKLI